MVGEKKGKTPIVKKLITFAKYSALSFLFAFAGYEFARRDLNKEKINMSSTYEFYKYKQVIDSEKCYFLSRFLLPISSYICKEHEIKGFLTSALASTYYNNFNYYATLHMNILESLEKEEIKELQNINGIELFARYDAGILKTAHYYLKSSNKEGKKVILVAASKYDNNAFMSIGSLINDISSKYGDKYLVMPIEINSKEELLNRLKILTGKIGKISLLIIAAHGLVDGTGVQLGYKNGIGYFFTIDDEHEMQEMKKYLLYKDPEIEMPKIVLISCYAGLEGGFAEKLAKITRAAVIAAVSYVYMPATLFIAEEEVYGFPEDEDNRLSRFYFYKGENFWRLKRVIRP